MKITESKLRKIIRNIILENEEHNRNISNSPEVEKILLALKDSGVKNINNLRTNIHLESIGGIVHGTIKGISVGSLAFTAFSILLAIAKANGMDFSAIGPEHIAEYANQPALYHLMMSCIAGTLGAQTHILTDY